MSNAQNRKAYAIVCLVCLSAANLQNNFIVHLPTARKMYRCTSCYFLHNHVLDQLLERIA
jgi:hypothetical protein